MSTLTPPPPRDPLPAPAPDVQRREFRDLRASGDPGGASLSIGTAIANARDRVAQRLIVWGATPNRITVAGFLITCGAAYCLARGAGHQVPWLQTGPGPVSWWPNVAALLLFVAGACDMLDGAVARVGRLGTRAGAVLDSSIDRFSDMAIYFGCFLFFARLPEPNLTYQVLAIVALCNGVLISYVKARAEEMIDDCSVGYWLRGERFAAVLIGCTVGHIPAVLWQMSVSCLFTVIRRITFAYATVQALDQSRPLPPRGPVPGWLGKVQLWRHPRGSVAYDIVTGAHIAFIISGPMIWPALLGTGAAADPLTAWLG